MPIYEFFCEKCGFKFEEIMAADAAAPACPSCGADAVKKAVSAPGPLKKGAFPYKPVPGKVMPLGGGGPACGNCGK